MTDANNPTGGNRPPSQTQEGQVIPAENPYQTPNAAAVSQGPKTSSLAITGFILALMPLVCTNFVGIILGIIALTKISAQPAMLKGKGLAIAAIVIGAMWSAVGILGILAAIAIPNFINFQARAKQSEAKMNLKAIFVGAKSSFAENGKMGTTFEAIGFKPDGTRYTYYFGDDSIEPEQALAEPLPDEVETFVEPDSGKFRAVAIGNVDSDDTLDVWIIDDENHLENISNDVDEY
ncbi:MAG: hypothetical protein A2289_10540 [Deltaproteobacteria bacterium RIFOXYA12_FULL_58_15]|nr:MAG: hypothetical protein A2289_10540 [Deltaproteobacteria bacterium RIFOXYA12_FULL_58_15]